jgi:hypothetical protein
MSSIETIRGRQTRVDQYDGESSAVIARAEAVIALSGAERVYETVADMVADTAIIEGDMLRTLGYFAAHDGGGAQYTAVTTTVFATTPDGLVSHSIGTGLVAQLTPGREMKAEYAGVVLSGGVAVARGDRFNAAFWYAADNGLDFSASTDFLTRGILEMTTSTGDFFSNMNVDMPCTITAQSGGDLTLGGTLSDGTVFGPHSQSRPLPMIHFKGEFSVINWPRLECENVCAGVKLKGNRSNVNNYPEIFGFSRYGWWPAANNDSKTFEPVVKQMYRDPDWMTSVGLDPTDWTEWNGDCIVIGSKDFMFQGGNVGWGGPIVRMLDGTPTTDAARIPGQNCYWCGLCPDTDYLEEGEGSGDVIFDNLHGMQGIGNTAFIDIGADTRYGAFMDWDLATETQVIRTVDSPVGVLCYCKDSNLSFFDRFDNDSCVHLLYGQQVEFTNETPGSSATTQTISTDPVQLLDPKIRYFASRGSAGLQRRPFMVSAHHERKMTMAFFSNPAEIYWNGSALVTANTDWEGSWDEWNKLNRASGTFGGQQNYRGRISEPTATGPSSVLAGDYWVVRGSISFTTGTTPVTAVDGQLLWALIDAPVNAADWLVVDADTAPVRDNTKYFETEARPHQTIVYPDEDNGVSQRDIRTSGTVFRERWGFTGDPETVTRSWNNAEYRIESSVSPTNVYLAGLDTGFSVTGSNMVIRSDGDDVWEFLKTDAVFRPAADDTSKLGALIRRIKQAFIKEIYIGAGSVSITSGTGSPEGVVTAPVSSIFLRSDGGAGTSLYVKQTGTGNTGWVGK